MSEIYPSVSVFWHHFNSNDILKNENECIRNAIFRGVLNDYKQYFGVLKNIYPFIVTLTRRLAVFVWTGHMWLASNFTQWPTYRSWGLMFHWINLSRDCSGPIKCEHCVYTKVNLQDIYVYETFCILILAWIFYIIISDHHFTNNYV